MKKTLLSIGILTIGFLSYVSAATTGDYTCIKTAVETRESSILTAIQTFHSGVNTAFETRKTEISQAWVKTTIKEIRLAVKNAVNKYVKTLYQLKQTLKKSKLDAWTKFRTDIKTCNSTLRSALNTTIDSYSTNIGVGQ